MGGNDQLHGNGGNDTLRGDGGDDYLSGDAGNDWLLDSGGGADIYGGDGNDTIIAVADSAGWPYSPNIEGGNDNDFISIFGSEGANASGDAGNDTIVGGDGADELGGSDGADSILGGGGADQIYLASFANTTVSKDTAFGGAGDDEIRSEGGGDIVDGGADTDRFLLDLYGSTTVSSYYTVDGAGVLRGSDGTQASNFERFLISTGAGDDTIVAGAGDDFLYSGAGSDLIDGRGGNDTLWDEQVVNGTASTLLGGDGNDSIRSMGGADSVDGGAGDDVLTINGPSGSAGSEYLVDGSGTLTTSAGLVARNVEDFRILAGVHADTIRMGAGDDYIESSNGNDMIAGGGGNDYVVAGWDDDTVSWSVGDGNDTLVGDLGNDVLDLEGWTPGASNPWVVGTAADAYGYTTYTHTPSGAVIRVRGFESIVCFADGTRILTPLGEVAIESLRAGDLVIVPLAGRRIQPLRWVGRRHIDLSRVRDSAAAAPVLIRAGALGPGTPCRDLRVSPEHGFLLDGRLVPAALLVDGAAIVQESWCRAVTYWHLELDAHGILVADGALAESYLDDGNRHFFDNAAVTEICPSFTRQPGGRYAALACAPPILDRADPALAPILRRLRGRQMRVA